MQYNKIGVMFKFVDSLLQVFASIAGALKHDTASSTATTADARI